MDRVAELVKQTRDETFVERAAGRQDRQQHAGDLLARRRDDGQRVEPRPAEADARPRDRRDREPGPHMTQLQCPRSGGQDGARRRDDVRRRPGRLGLHHHHGLEHGREPPGGVPLGDEGQGARREADPRRSALHADLGGGRHLRADPDRQRHRLPGRADPLRHREQPATSKSTSSTTPTPRRSSATSSRTPRISTASSPA